MMYAAKSNGFSVAMNAEAYFQKYVVQKRQAVAPLAKTRKNSIHPRPQNVPCLTFLRPNCAARSLVI
jgi:hypothetical protein